MSIDTQEIAKWLLVIGIYAGAFLVTTELALDWAYRMIIYSTVFMLITGTALKPEVINLLNLVDVAVNRNRDTAVVQTKR